jgi:C-terminal processing protease CtpA/Prc
LDSLNKLIPLLNNYKNIIADFRGYPEFNADAWLPHLIDKNISIPNMFFVEQIIYPNHQKNKLKTFPERVFYPKTPKLNAKIVYLINRDAVSAAETFLSFLKELNTGIFIGQQTAGTTGNVVGFKIPGGYSIQFTGMVAKKPNGKQFHGIGIVPDIEVNSTLEGVKEGKDEILERALEYIKTGK